LRGKVHRLAIPAANGASVWNFVTNTHPFNGPFSGTTQVSRHQKGKTNLDFTEARDSEWQWHHLGYMQVCTSLQTDNHASTPPLSFLQAGCPSCRPTNSVNALKAITLLQTLYLNEPPASIDRHALIQPSSNDSHALLLSYRTAMRRMKPKLDCADIA